MRCVRLLLLVVSVLAAPRARADATPPLNQRAHDVIALFASKPAAIEPLFSPEFFAHVPAAQVAAIVSGLRSRLGECREARLVERKSATQGAFDLLFPSGYRVPMSLAIEPAPPYRISGLWFGNAVREAASLGDVARELGRLPGEVSFRAVDLGSGSELAGLNPDRSLAIGSAFKLYVLAALLRSVENGKRRWDDVVRLDPTRRSLPTGALRTWPAGSPVTLHSLAARMISESDNTAADELLAALGRSTVEALLAETGIGHPERNRPFLSTGELFRLKWGPEPGLRERYLRAEESGRRRLLDETVGRIPLDKVDVSPEFSVAIDSIEWFASSSDLARTMDWFRNDSSLEGGVARAILAINPGLPVDRRKWTYVGFKGGSEPGVVNLTFLLGSATQRWYSVAATWNDTTRTVDEAKFEGLLQRVIELLPSEPAP